MGTVSQCCSNESKSKLRKTRRENEMLKQELVKTHHSYRQLKQKRQITQNKKNNQLYASKTKTDDPMLRERKEFQRESKPILLIENKTIALKRKELEFPVKKNIIICECDRIKLAIYISGYIRQLNIDIPMDITGVIFAFYDCGGTLLDEEDVSPRMDMVRLRNWLIYKNLSERDLKPEICKLLTRRRWSNRTKMPTTYKQRYGSGLMDDISKVIKDGPFLELVDGLFRTRIEFDAYCIKDIVTNRTNEIGVIDVAYILCCRNMSELQLICDEYKRMYSVEMRDKIYNLWSSVTYKNVINHIFADKRGDNEGTIKQNVEYLMDTNVDYKNIDDINKLSLMVLTNNEDYIRDLHSVFLRESNMNLIDFIDKKIGEGNVLTKWMKIRIKYCLDSDDFYAERIIKIGDDNGWNERKTSTDINRIFISTFDMELKNIQKTFNKMNYGDGKSMIEWITTTFQDKQYVLFLSQMLQTCKCKRW